MLNIILIAVAALVVAIILVKLVEKLPKLKPFLIIVLWVLIGYFGYQTYMSIYEPIQFNKVKNKRYLQVIESLKDIRDSQLAHKQVTGKFAGKFEDLIKFVDTAEFTITQRRDSSIIDQEMTRRYGVDTFKDIVIVDTLGFVSIKDSLFNGSDSYKNMMNVPVGKPGSKFDMEAGFIVQNKLNIPVFEAKVKKDVILYDLNKDLLVQENQVVSVDGVNGDALKVGSMEEVVTSGNWPKTYGANE